MMYFQSVRLGNDSPRIKITACMCLGDGLPYHKL